MHTFLLYITGTGHKAEEVIETLRGFLTEWFNDQYSLEVIDILENPQRAEEDMILATPTLVKHTPPPTRKIIGNLRSKQALFALLNATNHAQ